MDSILITLVPLGPGSESLLTLSAVQTLRNAKKLVLRTQRHGAADYLRRMGVPFDTLDALYERCEDFDALIKEAAETLIGEARSHSGLCYAVSDPLSDATVRALVKALPQDMALRAQAGGSYADNAALAALCMGMDTLNLATITAESIGTLRASADCPQAIIELDNRLLASDVKLWLSDLFDDETPVVFVEDASLPCVQGKKMPLCEVDRQVHYDHRTALFVPAVSVYERQRADYEDFVRVIARLRGPDGCPWDRKQTHRTLRQYMIEEACEAAEALDGDDPMKIADELGDVLLQVVLCSAIAAEHRDFTDRDVTSLVTRKMISRHTHVFGGEKAKDAQDVVPMWEEAKRRERGAQTPLERALEVPQALPALMRTQKIIRRLTPEQPTEALAQEAIQSARRALDRLTSGGTQQDLVLLLQSCCALAHTLGLDAETALRSGTRAMLEALSVREEAKK